MERRILCSVAWLAGSCVVMLLLSEGHWASKCEGCKLGSLLGVFTYLNTVHGRHCRCEGKQGDSNDEKREHGMH